MTEAEIIRDLEIICSRALLGKSVFAFGADSFGKYAYNSNVHKFTIKGLFVYQHPTHPDLARNFHLAIMLDGYDRHKMGSIKTDPNFEFSFQALLQTEYIPRAAWTYVDQSADHLAGVSEIDFVLDLSHFAL